MELVALLAFIVTFVTGSGLTAVTVFFASLFTLHYVHRSIIYPLMTRTGKKKMPILIVLFAMMFNVVNGSINGDYLGNSYLDYQLEYFASPKFIVGFLLFIVGAVINIRSDYYLISLRKSNDPGTYVIPKGGLFKWISCPNHFGEIVEWIGFAVMCWSLPALAFAVWTASNLIPRAWQHHKWYRQKFAEYPSARRAVIPGIL